jgi:hypothetical protein
MATLPSCVSGKAAFYFLARPTFEARLECERIAGFLREPRNVLYASPRLFQEFANCESTPERVFQFTQRHGPLHSPALRPPAEAMLPQRFEFSIQDWLEQQALFRKHWELRMSEENPVFQLGIIPLLDATITPKRVIRLECTGLLDLLRAEMYFTQRERLRNCERSDCKTPYFVASDLREKFCSPVCAGRSKNESNRRWWAEHGEEWRARQRNARKKLKQGEVRGPNRRRK